VGIGRTGEFGLLETIYNIMLKYLVLLITIPLLYSCNSPASAHENSSKNHLAYIETAKFKHTKHVRKQQKDICERLKKIHKKLENRKAKKG
jgi:hypothetical protein